MPRLQLALLFSVLIPLSAATDTSVQILSGTIYGLPGGNADVRVFKGIVCGAAPRRFAMASS